MIKTKKILYDTIYIPSGMCLSVEYGDTSHKLHPVRDASLTGCKRRVGWHFLPKDAFRTEYKWNANRVQIFFN